MKKGFKGRLTTVILTMIASAILIFLSYFSHGHVELYQFLVHPIFLTISYLLGAQYDKAEQFQTLLKNNQMKLDTNRQKYQSLFEFHPDAVYEFDLEGKFISGNKSLERITGYSSEEIKKITFAPLIYKKDIDKAWHFFHEAVKGHTQYYDVRAITKDGNMVYTQVTNLPICIDNQIVGVFGIAKDVTELHISEQKYKIIAENSADLIGVLDKHDIIQYASPSYQRLLGYNPEDLIGTNTYHFIHPDDLYKFKKLIEQVKEDLSTQSKTIRYKTKNQQWIWVDAIINPVIKGNHLNTLVIVARDITERREQEKQLAYLAYHDPITGLPNRRSFENTLEKEINHCKELNKQLALLYFDLNRFKVINDSLGHNTGDILLKKVAERLEHTNDKDIVVTRLGGDEFAMLIRNIASQEEVQEVAKNILAVLSEPFLIKDYELHVTTSIGISMFPDDGKTKEELMKCADTAMYHSKKQERNYYKFFSPSIDTHKYNYISLENNLRKALRQQEFFLLYQPIVCVKTNQVVGVEALVRWQHPEWGIVSPADFIPIAEETGLIAPIGEWVIWEACNQLKVWEDKGFKPITMAINISLKQFASRNLLLTIEEAIAKTSINPKHLEIEITESTMMYNLELNLSILNSLKSKGIRISIDDFGTGYSSLNHLKRLPIDTLKIDRSFINDIPNNLNDVIITSSIMNMGKHLDLEVIAEGVESAEQIEYLCGSDCDKYQGFYFSPPISNDKIEEILIKYE